MEPWVEWADAVARKAAYRFHLEFDDASQAARLGAWKAFHEWKPGGSYELKRFVQTKADYAVIQMMRTGKGYGSEVGRGAYTKGERFSPLTSLDAPAGDSGGVLGDFVASAGVHAEEVITSCDLRRALALIPPRWAAIVTLVDIEGVSQAELARALGVSESRISQLRTRAFGRMRVLLTDAEPLAA